MMLRLALWALMLIAAAVLSGTAQADEPTLTPKTLEEAMRPENGFADKAPALAERVQAWFGEDALKKGTGVKREGRTVAWAVEAPDAQSPPKIVSEHGDFSRPLVRFGETPVYAVVETLPNGAAFRWHYDVDGKKVGGGQVEAYDTPPDCVEHPGVPKGVLTQQPKWKSKIFDGTERDWWVYVPAQNKAENPACVMVFQDGGGMKNYVPTAFDNLIAKGEMPVTVGVFINPGSFADGRSNRSFEYDTLSDQYVRFLLEEILPEVEKTVKLRQDAAGRAICGISSGGICSFTAAWERPDQFSKVLSWVGSFTGIASGKTLKEGGNNYPVMIRKTPHKPIRVFLQDGENDLDNEHGNWPLANQEMAKALAFAGYDVKFVYGHGFHSDLHGRSILPDCLRWLWRDTKPQP